MLVAVFATAGVVCVGIVALALNGTAASTAKEEMAMTAPPSASQSSEPSPTPASKNRVPNVMGLTPGAAQLQLKKAGLRGTVIPSAGIDESQCTRVVRQNPEAKTPWDPKQEVEIVIDACPPQATAAPASPPTLDFPAPPAGKTGERYRLSLAVDGGVEPYAWSLASGSLPQGLTLNPSTGMLSGTPVKAGIYPFTVMVTDNEDASATQAVKLVISPKPTPTPTPAPVVTKKVPNVEGLTPEAAKALLTKAGLKATGLRELRHRSHAVPGGSPAGPRRERHVGHQEAGGHHGDQQAVPAACHADPDAHLLDVGGGPKVGWMLPRPRAAPLSRRSGRGSDAPHPDTDGGEGSIDDRAAPEQVAPGSAPGCRSDHAVGRASCSAHSTCRHPGVAGSAVSVLVAGASRRCPLPRCRWCCGDRRRRGR